MPIRVPDARVSISSTISKPAPAPLANGHLSFVVYHRELATSVPETASVRIVAKVMQATAFAGGKPKSMAIEDTWAVRGGAVDLRIAPVPGNQEMIVIRAADPNFTLSPGRYVLMFKNQAYDFSVAGHGQRHRAMPGARRPAGPLGLFGMPRASGAAGQLLASVCRL